MTDSIEYVEVPFGGEAKDRAILLLAAVEESKESPSVVRTGRDGFIVPKSIAEKAGLIEGEKKSSGGRKKVAEKSDTKDKE